MKFENPFESAPADDVTRFIFVRHAQTDANAKHYLQGQSDGVLNETGVAQAARIAALLRPFFIEKVYSSNQIRAVATATAIANEHGLLVQTDPRLQEWNCGDWDAMPAVDFIRMIKSRVSRHPRCNHNGETFQQVRNRAEAVLSGILANLKAKVF